MRTQLLIASLLISVAAASASAEPPAGFQLFAPMQATTGEVYSGFEPMSWDPLAGTLLAERHGWAVVTELTNRANRLRYPVDPPRARVEPTPQPQPDLPHATAGFDGRAHPALVLIPFAAVGLAMARRRLRRYLKGH